MIRKQEKKAALAAKQEAVRREEALAKRHEVLKNAKSYLSAQPNQHTRRVTELEEMPTTTRRRSSDKCRKQREVQVGVFELKRMEKNLPTWCSGNQPKVEKDKTRKQVDLVEKKTIVDDPLSQIKRSSNNGTLSAADQSDSGDSIVEYEDDFSEDSMEIGVNDAASQDSSIKDEIEDELPYIPKAIPGPDSMDSMQEIKSMQALPPMDGNRTIQVTRKIRPPSYMAKPAVLSRENVEKLAGSGNQESTIKIHQTPMRPNSKMNRSVSLLKRPSLRSASSCRSITSATSLPVTRIAKEKAVRWNRSAEDAAKAEELRLLVEKRMQYRPKSSLPRSSKSSIKQPSKPRLSTVSGQKNQEIPPLTNSMTKLKPAPKPIPTAFEYMKQEPTSAIRQNVEPSTISMEEESLLASIAKLDQKLKQRRNSKNVAEMSNPIQIAEDNNRIETPIDESSKANIEETFVTYIPFQPSAVPLPVVQEVTIKENNPPHVESNESIATVIPKERNLEPKLSRRTSNTTSSRIRTGGMLARS